MTNEHLDVAFAAIDDMVTPENWVAAATAKGLMEGYHARWLRAHDDIDVMEIEKTYQSPLVNIGTGKTSRTYNLAGKIDKLAHDASSQGNLVVWDHKTTSMDIADPDAPYWRQLTVEGQPLHYELLLLANKIRIDRVVWDVIKKPGIRPKKIAKKEAAGIVSLGEYCGRKVSEITKASFAAWPEPREDAELYQIRLAVECTEDPDRYFQRRSVPHLQEELAEYAAELWDLGQKVRLCRNSGRHYRNSGACMLYGSPCKFLGICSGHDTPDSDRWQQKESIHAELDLDGVDLGILTNSRLRCFQTCRRKHYYEYELGIERVDEEEKEALFFGSLFHAALDAWWASVSGLERATNDDCDTESPTTAVGNSSSDGQEELAF